MFSLTILLEIVATLLQTDIDWSAIETVLQAAASAAAFSVLYYAKRKRRNGDEWNPTKFGATVLVGVAVGIVLALRGSPLSEASWQTEMAAMAGTVALVEALIKSLLTEI